MFNETLVTLTEKDGKISIESPFNREFVNELKGLVPSARWSGSKWVINASGKEQAETLLAKYYPAEECYQTVRIEWNLNRDDPQIDGVGLASISRDYWSWRKNCPVDFKVIEQNLESGGSRNHPGLFGKLIIEAQVRPGATISPTPAEVTILEDGEILNPLADFSTEALLAELTRRGVK